MSGFDRDRQVARFLRPSAASRPTPLFWWSGGDLDRERMAAQLDELAALGIGGTIVGYSHLPDVRLDHGDPAPLTDDWWRFFRWFVAASGARGLTVAFQDYGIIGPVLLGAAADTTGTDPATLTHRALASGGGRVTVEGDDVLTCAAIHEGSGEVVPMSPSAGGWTALLGDGPWLISVVKARRGTISGRTSGFDPMHPDAGRAVIDRFYERFPAELGGDVGSVFRGFFQDELDLGITMPMWNRLVAERLGAAGFPPERWLHALWHDLGERTTAFRETYREIVVGLLEAHYFRPVFDWHEAHSTVLMMDQLSRGDLRLGHDHYGDFLRTMRWFQGPGNDDPDLTGTRNVAAFEISASIAHVHDRPLVVSEAFHSSGWGVTPDLIQRGLNVGFAAGVTHVALHGLDHTTAGGWWEWASPDFHFRQPWWPHSRRLWAFVTRVSEVLRWGIAVSDVAVLDPTGQLDLGLAGSQPETVRDVLTGLSTRGVNVDLVPPSELGLGDVEHGIDGDPVLRIGAARYRALVVLGQPVLPEDAVRRITAFRDRGGAVLHVDGEQPGDVASAVRSAVSTELDCGASTVMFAHRRVGDADFYYVVNPTDTAAELRVSLRGGGVIERWDPWTGGIAPAAAVHRLEGRSVLGLALGAGEGALLRRSASGMGGEPKQAPPVDAVLPIPEGWEVEPVGDWLDNAHGDFRGDRRPLTVSTYRASTVVRDRDDGPARVVGRVDDEPLFWVLGPVPSSHAADAEALLTAASRSWPPTGLDAEGPVVAAPSWRPYRFSMREGIADDAYLLDRDTGPHGLKSVPAEFLDPRAVDATPPPGSVYFFLSSVAGNPGPSTVRATGRAAFTVWLGGERVVEDAETPAARFPPWGLRDMRADVVTAAAELAAPRTAVLVRVDVSATQPSRVGVAVGGAPSPRPARWASPWWQGDAPALPFRSDRDGTAAVVEHVSIAVPVAAVAAIVPAAGRVDRAVWNRRPAALEPVDASAVRVRRPDGVSGGGVLELWIEAPAPLFPVVANRLIGPVEWATEREHAWSTEWNRLGLQDHSGAVRFRRRLIVDERPSGPVLLRLRGLEGSAAVAVGGRPAGTLLRPGETVDLAPLLQVGTNDLEVETANTLQNLFAHLPSPYSHMQPTGGGFGGAELLVGEADRARLRFTETVEP